MSESNVLILQCDKELKDWELSSLYENILKQKDSGVILLPNYVKVVNVPEEEINGELVVMNSGAPEPDKYVLKCYDGRYIYRYTPGSSIIELTPDRTFAIVFSKARAEEMLKKSWKGLRNGGTLIWKLVLRKSFMIFTASSANITNWSLTRTRAMSAWRNRITWTATNL